MISLELRKGEVIEEKDLQMTFRCLLPECQRPQRYQVHSRYLLIDTETGYRNIFRKASFLMDVR